MKQFSPSKIFHFCNFQLFGAAIYPTIIKMKPTPVTTWFISKLNKALKPLICLKQ